MQRTRDGGAEIVKHLKTGQRLLRAIGRRGRDGRSHPQGQEEDPARARCILQGEYGINGYFVGVPCKLGARGLEQIIEIKLTPDEDAAFKKSAAAVKELCAVIGV